MNAAIPARVCTAVHTHFPGRDPQGQSTRRPSAHASEAFPPQSSATQRSFYQNSGDIGARGGVRGGAALGRESSHLLPKGAPGLPFSTWDGSAPPLPASPSPGFSAPRSKHQESLAAPPPSSCRGQRVMNGLAIPGSFSHAGTRRRAPRRRRRFNTRVSATTSRRVNGPPLRGT